MSETELQVSEVVVQDGDVTEHYLSITQIAKLWKISQQAATKAMKHVKPDAVVGRTKGWKLETVNEVREAQPGKGNWGPREPKTTE